MRYTEKTAAMRAIPEMHMSHNLEHNLDLAEGRAAKSLTLDLLILVMAVAAFAFAALLHQQHPVWAYTILAIGTALLAVRLIERVIDLAYRLYKIRKEVKSRRDD